MLIAEGLLLLHRFKLIVSVSNQILPPPYRRYLWYPHSNLSQYTYALKTGFYSMFSSSSLFHMQNIPFVKKSPVSMGCSLWDTISACPHRTEGTYGWGTPFGGRCLWHRGYCKYVPKVPMVPYQFDMSDVPFTIEQCIQANVLKGHNPSE